MATVSQEGVLKLLSKGTVTISAVRYGDGYILPKNVEETSVSKEITVGTTTDIYNVGNEQPAAEGIYDILGRRISAITTSGIYIVNGKKVVVNK